MLPGEAKYLVSVKKLLAGEGDLECFKEVLGRIIDTKARTVALPERKLQEMRDLLGILTTQQRMGRKELERLVGKLHSMHLVVPGAVAHLYHVQRTVAQEGAGRSWLSPDFYREIANWRMLTEQTANQLTHLADIICPKPTHMGFCDASGLGAGGMWLYPSHSGKVLAWRHPWPADIIANLVSSTIREGTITNSDLELAALVLHQATLLAAVPDTRLAAPCSSYDNTPDVSWIMKEASTINMVVADLLRLRALHS